MPSLACPACGAIYRVPDSAMGRQLKCAKCAHQWKAEPGQIVSPFGKAVEAFAAPPAAAPAPTPAVPQPAAAEEDDILARRFEPAPPRPAEEAEDGPPRAPVMGPLRGGAPMAASSLAAAGRPSRRNVALALAWAASLAAVVGGLYAAALHRTAIADAWPPFGRVAGWFGG